jgi:DNA-binding PadR family transcriptional regulator
MSTSHVLLGLLAGGPRHGYDLKRSHDRRLARAKPVAFGQVYATLGRLQRDGLVATAGHDRDSGPDRTSFEITRAGRTALDAWLGSVEPPAPFVTSTLFAKVIVALLVTGEERARDYLVAQRAAHMDRLRELTAAKTDPATPLGDVITADFAILHLDADLRWVANTLERVADLHREVHS